MSRACYKGGKDVLAVTELIILLFMMVVAKKKMLLLLRNHTGNLIRRGIMFNYVMLCTNSGKK